jgi:hypothetical protein
MSGKPTVIRVCEWNELQTPTSQNTAGVCLSAILLFSLIRMLINKTECNETGLYGKDKTE